MRNLPVIYPWFPVIYPYFPVTTCLAEKTQVILKETSFFLANPAPSRFVYFTAKNLRSQSLVWTRQKVDPNGLATPFQRGSRLSQHAVQAEIIWPSNWADPSPTQVVWAIVHERLGRNITFHFQPSGVPKFLARHLHWRRKKKSSGCTLREEPRCFAKAQACAHVETPWFNAPLQVFLHVNITMATPPGSIEVITP